MDSRSAHELAEYLRQRSAMLLWILDEGGSLRAAAYEFQVESSGEWPMIVISEPGDGGEDDVCPLSFRGVAAVKACSLRAETRYFGDCQRLVSAEISLKLESARAAMTSGRPRAALTLSAACFDQANRELGPSHRLGIQALTSVAESLRRLGSFQGAHEHARRACSLARDHLSSSDHLLPEAIRCLALTHAELGELKVARSLAHEAYILTRQSDGAMPSAVAEALATLSMIDCRRGRFVSASSLAEKGLRHLASLPESSGSTRAQLLHLRGLALCLNGSVNAARHCLEISLWERWRMFGETHPETIEGLASLGTFFLVRGQFDDAATLFRKALRLARRSLGAEHVLVQDYTAALAFACKRPGRRQARGKAIALIGRGRRIRRRAG